MPKQTFFNLPEEKRLMIEEALLDIFCDQHISQVKVARIVEETKISRAAFYKYFSTLEDAHTYMSSKISGLIHQDVLTYIECNKHDFFRGISQFLVYCSELPHDSSHWKGIKLLIKGENTELYQRMPLSADSPLAIKWRNLLQLNAFKMKDEAEAISFLYFIRDLVIDSLASFIANDWGTGELLNDFSYKANWLLKGIK